MRDREMCRCMAATSRPAYLPKVRDTGKTSLGHSSCARGGRKAASAPVMVRFDGVSLRKMSCKNVSAVKHWHFFVRGGVGCVRMIRMRKGAQAAGARGCRRGRALAQDGWRARRFGIPCGGVRNRIWCALGRKDVLLGELFQRRRLLERTEIGRFRVKVYKLTKLLCKSGNYSYICTL